MEEPSIDGGVRDGWQAASAIVDELNDVTEGPSLVDDVTATLKRAIAHCHRNWNEVCV